MRNSIYLSTFLTFFLFISHSQSVIAAHIIGGEMTYQCTGDDNYTFTMTLYRDCIGGGACFDSQISGCPGGALIDATVTVYSNNTILTVVVLDEPTVEDITSVDQVPTPPNVCIEKGVYTFDLNLPAGNHYNVVYQRCCRGNDITNIENPGISGMTIHVEVPAQVECNSAPVFNEDPIYYANAGEYLEIDKSASDADGDSLVYELCSPFLGGGDNAADFTASNGVAPDPDSNTPYGEVAFSGDFTSQAPFLSSTSVSIDPETGILSGTPTAQGKFVITVCVKEYRNGDLISTVRREFLLVVVQTTNTKEQELADLIEIYPNPTKSIAFLNIPDNIKATAYSIFDFRGLRIGQSNDLLAPIDLNQMPSGIYYVRIETGQGLLFKRLLKQ